MTRSFAPVRVPECHGWRVILSEFTVDFRRRAHAPTIVPPIPT